MSTIETKKQDPATSGPAPGSMGSGGDPTSPPPPGGGSGETPDLNTPMFPESGQYDVERQEIAKEYGIEPPNESVPDMQPAPQPGAPDPAPTVQPNDSATSAKPSI